MAAELADYLIGDDPLRIEDHWQILTKGGFYRGGPVLSRTVAGIDQALWDVAGKAADLPVYAMLGEAVRERARMYAWVGGDRPAEVSEQAATQIEVGFTAVKLTGTGDLAPIDTPARTREAADRIVAVREAIGEHNVLIVDLHGRATTAMARRLPPMLEPYLPLFVEEAVLPAHSRNLAALAAWHRAWHRAGRQPAARRPRLPHPGAERQHLLQPGQRPPGLSRRSPPRRLSWKGTPLAPPVLGSASRSTRPRLDGWRATVIVGVTRCGGARTAPSPSGDDQGGAASSPRVQRAEVFTALVTP
ncbi:enolase C-terminal domain-like protein [[Actinomadura] parvosata]|uniref:enolase C-terminal domain-like protein n=1 Tax=[Actinomadura] parvosata TaxID=1955412 RepID=UPI00406C824E